MGLVMLARHALKGDGNEYGTHELSPGGILGCRALGKNLPPQLTSSTIAHVGGSAFSRTTVSVLHIASAAGFDPEILPSNPLLGSSEVFDKFTALGADDALEKNDWCYVRAVRSVCPEDLYESVQRGILRTVAEASRLKGGTLLGTHSPFLQMAIEGITGREMSFDAKELDWVIIYCGHGTFGIVASSMKLDFR